MGGSATLNTSETKIEALKLQSSAYGVTVPLVGGMARIPGNLLYYTDFKAIANTTSQTSGGKGGGVKTQNTTYTYKASVVMGLCHGPIQDIKSIWVGKKRFDSSWSQGPTSNYVEQYILGAAGSTFTLNNASGFIGIQKAIQTVTPSFPDAQDPVLAEGTDYSVNQSTGVVKMLNDSWNGMAVYFWYSTQPAATYSTAAQQLGISLVTGYAGQPAPGWVQSLHPSDAVGYPYQAYIHAQDYSLGSGAQVENHTFEVLGFGAYSVNPSIPDCNPADFVRTVLLDGRYGARLPAGAIQSFSAWSSYCLAAGILMSPALTQQMKAADLVTQMARLTNSAPIWSVSKLKMVPYGDKAMVGNGASYSPNVTPIYDLTDDHFIYADGEAPVRMTRNSRADRYNNVKLQYQSRANFYNKEVVEVKDDADVSVNGLRTMQDVQADWICDAGVAQTVAQLLMQRSLNVTATFEFKLSWAFCLLEPMDLVTLTDPDLGLNKSAVRITDIEEDENGLLTVTAESFAQGVASSTLYPSQRGSGYQVNYNATPRSVLPPAFFELPGARTSNGLGVYAAATGTAGDATWGGCNVWVSLDGGTNYKRLGTITGGARMGRLTQAMAAGDTSAKITLDGLGGQINNASASVASQNQSLVWIEGPQGGEYVNHTTATLTGANSYTLAVQRGAYANPVNAHSAGARVVKVDDAVVASGFLDLSFIGKTLTFKFTSFNVFGAGEESMANVQAYSYTVTGGQANLPPANCSNVQIAGQSIAWTGVGDTDLAGYRVRMQSGVNTDWGTAIPLHDGLLTASPFTMAYKPPGTVTIMVKAVDLLGNESVNASAAIANLGNTLVSNVFESWPQAPSWAGAITGGAAAGGALSANSLTAYWPQNTAQAFWNLRAATFWPAQTFAQLQYLFNFRTTSSGRLLLDQTVQADSTYVEYQRGDQTIYWPVVTSQPFWNANAGATFWPAFTPQWKPWLGGLDLLVGEPVTMRTTYAGGPNQASVTVLTPKMDVPDVSEVVYNIAVSSTGTRIPLAKSYRVIKNINCSIPASGAATGFLIGDYDPVNGPLVYLVNSAGTRVNGTINAATIQGY